MFYDCKVLYYVLLLTILLYGSEKVVLNISEEIASLTNNFRKVSERFAEPLF